MPISRLNSALTRLRKELLGLPHSGKSHPLLDRLRAAPSSVMTEAGLRPDPWQAELLASASPRLLLLASRQSGKSEVSGMLALHQALTEPNSLVLLLSPSERQSGELFQSKVIRAYHRLGKPVRCIRESALQLSLANGSRIVALPAKESTIRVYAGVKLIVVDEAARVPDELYFSVRPMLAVNQGRLLGLSSAWAKQGWFYRAWTTEDHWHKFRIPATQCPRISEEFLQEERQALGELWYQMEYNCTFMDAVSSLFSTEDLEHAQDDSVQPLFRRGFQ